MKLLRIFLALFLLALPAHATVTNSVSSTTIAGNASQTVFTFNFIGVTANDITVIFTDAAGNQTVVPQGQYTLSLNSALPGNIWGIGGSVTYPLVGSPIASGTTLTIARSVPNTQTVSSNQGQAFPTAVEAGMDLLAMQIQQFQATGKVLEASPADTCSSLGFLPQAIQRANQVIGFDGTGCNPVAVSTLPVGVVSSAMQPVVSAASLSAGRTAFGLGAMATEGIGAGLQDNGGGSARVNFTTASDSTGQTVDATYHLTQRFATGAITYTLPITSGLWNGYGFWITALTGQVTLSPNAADNFAGMGSGVALVILPGQNVFITTNGAGTWWAQNVQLIGSTTPLNLQISTSVASNKLTVAVKNLNGNDPSPTSPVLAGFRSQTATNGNTIIGTITAPLSFTVNAASSMGCTTTVVCRLWGELICQTESSGACTSILVGLSLQSSATNIYPLLENVLQTTGSGINGGTTINTIQTSVSALSNKAIRIAFYVEAVWTNSVGWAAPTVVQIFGPGIKKPGDVVQRVFSTNSTSSTSNTSFAAATNFNQAITPTSVANIIHVVALANFQTTANDGGYFQLSRGTPCSTLIGMQASVSGTASVIAVAPVEGFDYPATASSTTYALCAKSSVNGATAINNNAGNISSMTVEEIMGALEPANDNQPLRKVV